MSQPLPVPLVVALPEIQDDHLPLVGGKGGSLAQLARAGFAVPEAFVVTTEAFRRATGSLAPELAKVEEQLRSGGLPLDESWVFLAELRAKVERLVLPEELRAALRAACAKWLPGDPAVAVRSSGTKEDLAGSSFAGQYETFLNVRGHDAIELAVKRCWASVWRNRVLQYATRRAGGTSGLAMAVVVQRLVAADVSGVLFTVNPITGREREALVEACFGLGEALVSGKVNADRYVVDTANGELASKEIARKGLKLVPAQGAGNTGSSHTLLEMTLSEEEALRPTLHGDATTKQLAEVAAGVQEHYGRPMDLEWVLEKGKLYLVQARPITKISFAPDTGEWTTADFRDGGVSSDVCSPFMWSLYESVLEHTLPQYFVDIGLLPQEEKAATKWSRSFFARPYWNLGAVKRVLEKIPGYTEREFDKGLGVKIHYEGPGKQTGWTIGGLIEALPVVYHLDRCYKKQLARDKAFAAAFPERRRPFDLEVEQLRQLDDATFASRIRELFTRFYFETEATYFYTIYNTTNAKTDLAPVIAKVKKVVPDLDELKLVGGLENLSHLRPMKDLHATVAQLRRESRSVDEETVRQFARRWKHHGRKELDIRVPRWRDDPEAVRTILEEALASFDPARDPQTQERAQNDVYRAELDRAIKALDWKPFLRSSFKKKLELVRTYAWWREEMRDHSTIVYDLVRLWAVEAGRRLVARGVLAAVDDVFLLSFQDALAAIEGAHSSEETQKRVRAGLRLLRSFRNFENPGELGPRHGLGAPAGASAIPGTAASGALRGIGCSPGRVRAKAKVVRKLEEAKKVEKGDVLVTFFTDPGWTPLLGRVSAVVTETGGVLSHAAVISREYGIPAVLAVQGAVSSIQDGDEIVVDGVAGTVEKVQST